MKTICISLELFDGVEPVWKAVAPLEWPNRQTLNALMECLKTKIQRYGKVVRCEWHCNDTGKETLLYDATGAVSNEDLLALHPEDFVCVS